MPRAHRYAREGSRDSQRRLQQTAHRIDYDYFGEQHYVYVIMHHGKCIGVAAGLPTARVMQSMTPGSSIEKFGLTRSFMLFD